jgi:hypothetical protein
MGRQKKRRSLLETIDAYSPASAAPRQACFQHIVRDYRLQL